MSAFNIKYPVVTGTDGNIVKKAVEFNNGARIRFLLDFIPGQRPHHPKYGSLLRRLEQDSLPHSTQALASLDQLRETLDAYGSDYYQVESVAIVSDQNDPTHIVNLQINHSNKR